MDLEIEDGEFMVLVGPSGCGKTTALRMVAGLEEISEGVVRIGERVVNHVPPRDRDIAMVFQSYALYPHLSVYDNIAFGLKLRKEKKAEIEKRVHEAAGILGLEPFLKRKPRALSGGQRQRVAMGRAIVRRPQAFLMDEPLSNLDAKLRVQTRAEIAQAPERPRYDDDLRHARPGRGDDDGRPRRRHAQRRAPAGRDAAGPLRPPGQPLRRRFHRQPRDEHARGDARQVERRPRRRGRRPAACDRSGAHLRAARSELYEGKKVVLGIRPEDLEDAALAKDVPADRRLKGKVELIEALGSEIMAHFTIDAPPALTDDVRELAQDVGDERAVEEAAEGASSTRPWSGVSIPARR